MRQRAALVYLLLVLMFSGSLRPAFGESIRSGPFAHSGSSLRLESPYVWIARWVIGEVISYGFGKVLDAALARAGLANRASDAAANLRGMSGNSGLSAAERQELRRLAGQMEGLAALLARNDLNDAQVRRQIQQMQTQLNEMRRRIDALERRITVLEREQRRQMRVLVDHEARIIRLEERVAGQGRRIRRVEDVVFPDSNRFLRHDAYLMAGILYANSAKLGNDAAVGFEAAGQYNFDQFFGVFGGVQLAPLRASDVQGMPVGSSVSWEGLNAHLGAAANLMRPRQPVSLQIGAGGGISQTKLLYFAPGTSRDDSESAEELGTSSNIYMLVKADVGVAPPAFEFEPVMSFGYMTFFEDMTYTDDVVSSNAGRGMWYVSVGLRWRAYLRGRPAGRD